MGGHAWPGPCMAGGGLRGKGGACVAKGGVHGKGGACVAKGGHAWQRGEGACVTKVGGVCGMHAPLQDMAGQCVGSTHPTGMHSCLFT